MKTKRLMVRLVKAAFILCVLIAAVLGSGLVYAAGSPFAGRWQAVDLDGSDIQLIIGGPTDGPFNITIVDSHISFCDGEAGLIRGEGWLNEGDQNLLEAEMHLECFTTGLALDFHMVWRYHPSTNLLSSNWEGFMIVWSKSGPPQAPPQPLELRINYGHDWIESFYEGGHTAWVTVTGSDGVTVKATTEVITEAKWYWDGETGFQTGDSEWVDAAGEPIEGPPDIQPFDWVYGWVDNGASALVQIGEISGFIDFEADSIQGRIIAPWYSDELSVECFPWGAPEPQPEMKYDAVYSEDAEGYSCSWAGEWEIGIEQDIGVGYFGPDGHWVATAFYSNAWFVASESGDWFWTNAFAPESSLGYFIYESSDPGAALLGSGSSLPTDEGGFVFVGHDDHFVDMVPGSYLVIEDGYVRKGLVLETISIDVFDTVNDIMVGTAPFGREVWAAAGLQDYQERIPVFADIPTDDLDVGSWFADFGAVGWDIIEEMRPWSYVSLYDVDGDSNEGSTLPLAPLIVANQPDWVDTGITFSAGQSFTVEALGLMNPCLDTYPNGAEYCIFYAPTGNDYLVPYESEFGIFPGPGLRFMALLGRIGDGEPFYIGGSGAFTADQEGTLWLTPNDNLRKDNQGAYSVWVWLDP